MLVVFVVTYDLVGHKSGHDYRNLWSELGQIDGHRVQESVWFVSTYGTTQQVADRLAEHMHAGDKIFVTRMHANDATYSEYYFRNANSGTNAWLKDHPPS